MHERLRISQSHQPAGLLYARKVSKSKTAEESNNIEKSTWWYYNGKRCWQVPTSTHFGNSYKPRISPWPLTDFPDSSPWRSGSKALPTFFSTTELHCNQLEKWSARSSIPARIHRTAGGGFLHLCQYQARLQCVAVPRGPSSVPWKCKSAHGTVRHVLKRISLMGSLDAARPWEEGRRQMQRLKLRENAL